MKQSLDTRDDPRFANLSLPEDAYPPMPTSRYLIEYKGFFSRSYLVMTLLDWGIQLSPLASDPDAKDGTVTRLDWD